MFPLHYFKNIPVILLCCLSISLATAHCSLADISAHGTYQMNRSLWVWDATAITDAQKENDLLDFCKTRAINTIFIDLGDFDSDIKRPNTDLKHLTSQHVGDFAEKFHAANIKVEALNGDPHFALRERHQSTLDKMQRVLDYNAKVSAKRRLDGYQWDIEPHALKEYKTDQHDSILEQYLEFVNKAASMVKDSVHSSHFDLGFAVPFWFDRDRESAMWKGEKRPVIFSVIDILAPLPKSYIAIMAYRDHADGLNGSVALSQTEMDYTVSHKTNVGVWVGLETGKEEPGVTFYGKKLGDLEKTARDIDAAFSGISNYRGVAIHHWTSYDKLVKESAEK